MISAGTRGFWSRRCGHERPTCSATQHGCPPGIRFIGNLEKDERTKDAVQIVEHNMRLVVDEALAAIGAEIDRGAVILATALSAKAR